MTPDTVRTASEAAHQAIKSWILAGEIPLGMRLSEGRIAARLAVSRTPVREALLRLFAERFIERHPDGGYRVRHPRARAMHELYDVRTALELFALGRTVDAADHERVVSLRDDWLVLRGEGDEPNPDFVLLDEDFHVNLAAASGNDELVAALQRVAERIRPVRTHDFLIPERIATTIDQHLGILDATLAGDPYAVTLLEQHIGESQRYVETAVAQVLERMLSTSEESLTW